jgi:hypothetical protein
MQSLLKLKVILYNNTKFKLTSLGIALVCSVLLEIQPRERYYGRKSTLMNQSMAQSFMINALFCISMSKEMYTDWLQEYHKSLVREEELVVSFGQD